MRPLAVFFAALIGVAVCVLLAGWISGCGLRSVDESDYVAHNEAVFRELHQYPGAMLVNSDSVGIPKPGGLNENGPPYGSFVTWHVYRVSPAAQVKSIVRYFHRTLRKWTWKGPGAFAGRPPCEAGFSNSDATSNSFGAFVYIVACSTKESTTTYLMHIDYIGGQ